MSDEVSGDVAGVASHATRVNEGTRPVARSGAFGAYRATSGGSESEWPSGVGACVLATWYRGVAPHAAAGVLATESAPDGSGR